MNTLDKAYYEYHNNIEKSVKQILEEYNLDTTTFYKNLDYKEPLRKDKKHREYDFNISKMQLDSAEKFYWLGFIAADGAIVRNTLSIELKDIDKHHLEKFKEFLEADNPIQYYKHPKCESYKINISSKELIEYLKEYNLAQNKSLIYVIPEDKIPNEYLMDFIRGIIDGDGCVRVNNHQQISLSFCGGSETCVNQVRDILGITNIVGRDGNTYRFQVTGNRKAKAILDKIYANSKDSTRLDRKYKVYYDKFLKETE